MPDVKAPQPKPGRRPRRGTILRVLVALAIVALIYLTAILFVAPNVADRVEVQVRTHPVTQPGPDDLIFV